MARKNRYQYEIDTIVAIRKTNPDVGPYTLAKQIKTDRATGVAEYRSFYSIYSVIRRYDAQQAKQPGKVAA